MGTVTADVRGRGRPTEDDRRGYQTRSDVTPVKTRAGSLTGGRAREDVLWRNQILASGISPAFRGRENGADDKWGSYGFERDARGAGKPKERRVARTTRYPDLFQGHFRLRRKLGREIWRQAVPGTAVGDTAWVCWAGDATDHKHGDSPPEEDGRKTTQRRRTQASLWRRTVGRAR